MGDDVGVLVSRGKTRGDNCSAESSFTKVGVGLSVADSRHATQSVLLMNMKVSILYIIVQNTS